MTHKRLMLTVLLAALGTCLTACSSNRVQIQSLAAPNIRLPDTIKRIAVLRFETVATGGHRLADGQQVANELVAQLAQEGYFQLIERSAVDRVTDELARGAGIQYDRETQKQIGRRLQADGLIFGSVNVAGTEHRGKAPRTIKVNTGRFQTFTNPQTGQSFQMPIYEDRVVQVDTLSRDVSVKIDFRLVDVETESILASKSISKTAHKPDRSFFNSSGMAVGDDVGSVPSLDSMANELVTDVVRGFVGHISPHRLMVSRVLIEGDSTQCQQGYECAKAGNWEGARQSWEQALRLNPGDFGALNNLAVYHESIGDNDQAAKFYSDALQRAPTNEDILANQKDFKVNVHKQ